MLCCPDCGCAVARCAECAAVLCCALQAATDEEPLALSGVTIAPAAEQALRQAWKSQQHTSLYKSPDQLISLVQQVGAGAASLCQPVASITQLANLCCGEWGQCLC
jgi:hypothetical protein